VKKVIVTTTIHPPTEAIEAFQAMEDWELVVIGDKKTPGDWRRTPITGQLLGLNKVWLDGLSGPRDPSQVSRGR